MPPAVHVFRPPPSMRQISAAAGRPGRKSSSRRRRPVSCPAPTQRTPRLGPCRAARYDLRAGVIGPERSYSVRWLGSPRRRDHQPRRPGPRWYTQGGRQRIQAVRVARPPAADRQHQNYAPPAAPRAAQWLRRQAGSNGGKRRTGWPALERFLPPMVASMLLLAMATCSAASCASSGLCRRRGPTSTTLHRSGLSTAGSTCFRRASPDFMAVAPNDIRAGEAKNVRVHVVTFCVCRRKSTLPVIDCGRVLRPANARGVGAEVGAAIVPVAWLDGVGGGQRAWRWGLSPRRRVARQLSA